MSHQTEALKRRTRQFALDALKVVELLPRREPAFTIAHQLTKSATSVAANYRASCRARSPAEFVARIGVVSEEADESELWLDLIIASGLRADQTTRAAWNEARELVAIFSASYGTARSNLDRHARNRNVVSG